MAAALVAIAFFSLNTLPSVAQVAPPPIASEPLTARADFPDNVDMKIKIKTDGGATRYNQISAVRLGR